MLLTEELQRSAGAGDPSAVTPGGEAPVCPPLRRGGPEGVTSDTVVAALQRGCLTYGLAQFLLWAER